MKRQVVILDQDSQEMKMTVQHKESSDSDKENKTKIGKYRKGYPLWGAIKCPALSPSHIQCQKHNQPVPCQTNKVKEREKKKDRQ